MDSIEFSYKSVEVREKAVVHYASVTLSNASPNLGTVS
jgi:hypothetical protein